MDRCRRQQSPNLHHLSHETQGCPLGVRHIFCLFDGHGGDSVAEYCRTYLADRIVQRIRDAQALATTSATTTEAATIAQSAQARVPANEAGKEGINEHPGGGGGGRTFGDGERGSDGGTATAAPYMAAGCVRDACREVDAEVTVYIMRRLRGVCAPLPGQKHRGVIIIVFFFSGPDRHGARGVSTSC